MLNWLSLMYRVSSVALLCRSRSLGVGDCLLISCSLCADQTCSTSRTANHGVAIS